MTKAEQRADLYRCEDAEVLLVACNTPARMAKGAVRALRERGDRRRLFRPQTLWPFPIKALEPLLAHGPADRGGGGERRAARGRAAAGAVATPAPARRIEIGHVRRMGGVLPSQRRDRRRRSRAAVKRRAHGVSTFYERFERHDHAAGLKGQDHPLLPRLRPRAGPQADLAEAIDELGLQDRTVAISPVGCSVFLYYYLDVGNTQAAHGRAPAVALGHKLANPEAIVISYQGDGDLASIGLAEIIHAAQLGLPVHGHLRQQRHLRHDRRPDGAHHADGPADRHQPHRPRPPHGRAAPHGRADGAARRHRLRGAGGALRRQAAGPGRARPSRRRCRLQVDGRGFAFVEVLAECPTHLGLTPPEAERWVAEKMVPVFPLGVKKEPTAEPLARPGRPTFHDPAELLARHRRHRGAGAALLHAASPTTGFGDDIAVKLAGAGGDGAQTAALLLTKAAINEGFDATHIPSYGPESRGGTSYADVRIAEDEVLSPAAPHPHVLVAFNAPSLARFGPEVRPGRRGGLRLDRGLAPPPALPAGRARRPGPLHRHRPRAGAEDGEERGGAGRAAGRDQPVPARDAGGRRPPGARLQAAAARPQRGGAGPRPARRRRRPTARRRWYVPAMAGPTEHHATARPRRLGRDARAAGVAAPAAAGGGGRRTSGPGRWSR